MLWGTIGLVRRAGWSRAGAVGGARRHRRGRLPAQLLHRPGADRGGGRHGRLHEYAAAATALTITGCVIILLGGSTGRVDAAGLAMAGVAGLAFPTYSGSAGRLITTGLPPTGVMAWLFGVGGLLLLPVLVLSDTDWLWTPAGLVVTVYLGVVTTAVAYALYGSGLRTVRVRTSATLSLADPGAAALLGLLVSASPRRRPPSPASSCCSSVLPWSATNPPTPGQGGHSCRVLAAEVTTLCG